MNTDKGIFKKNAIKCVVNSNSYSVKGSDFCQMAPPNGSEVYVLGYSKTCTHNSISDGAFTEGKRYFIAGRYYMEYCGATYLFLTHRSIVVEHTSSLVIPIAPCS